jgi:DNA-binding NtrC family response regulator
MSDLGVLVNAFLDAMKATDRAALFTPQVLADMARYDWPGNVRELRNHVARVVVLEKAAPTSGRVNTVLGMSRDALTEPTVLEQSFAAGKEQVVAEYERRYLTELMAWAGGNVSRAARKAGVDRMHLYRLLQKHDLHAANRTAGLQPPSRRGAG